MKKILVLFLLLLTVTCACGKKDSNASLKKFIDKANNADSYTLKGNMEIYDDEETFTYSIEADFLKDNYYKVVMLNQTNNHEQILLRNADAVYVITPSLNKSFKFQSDWPNNSSQSYLLKPIANDLNNDTEKTFEQTNDEYTIKSKVNYPNNPDLKYQKITLDKDGMIKKNEVYDDKDTLKMKVTFTSVDFNCGLKNTDFRLEDYIEEDNEKDKTESNNNNNNTSNNTKSNNTTNNESNTKTNETKKEECDEETCKEEKSTCEGDDCKQTGLLEDVMYPLYIPSNTYLSTKDKVDTDNGDRIILTFGGDKSFVLVEEKAVSNPVFEIIPVYGDPLMINDTIGAISNNSLTWTKDNISYYLAGNDLTTSELLNIGKSIRVEDLTVSKEK